MTQGKPIDVFNAATNTLRASWWDLLLARLFGKKTATIDAGGDITIRRFRGKYYLTDFSTHIKTHADN